MNILILGGYGYTGKLLAKHLLAQTNHNVILAGRNVEKATVYAKQLDSDRVSVRCVDAANADSLRTGLSGVDFLLVAAPTTHQADTVIEAAIHAGVDYLDVQFSDAKLASLNKHKAEIENKDLCFITEAGYHPGLPSAMVRYAAGKLDSIESALTAGYLNIGEIPFSDAVDELMEAFLHYQAQVYKNGAWTKPSSWDMRKFDFGGDIGKRDCYSMFFEEMRALPEMIPTLKNTGFYISGSNWIADLLVTPIVMIGLKLFPKRGIRPLGKLMWWAMGKSKPPYRVVLKVDAKGSLNRIKTQVQARCEHEDGYELTAIPVVALLMQYERIRKSGLHMMGHLVDPDQLFCDMEMMGATFVTSVVAD
ncbi:MAG: saccharopine dehydrogenase NADP-binding domain-containing protein [Anaerolineales bacterium]